MLIIKLALGSYALLILFGIVASILTIGKPREPLSPAGAGCSVLFGIFGFTAILLAIANMPNG